MATFYSNIDLKKNQLKSVVIDNDTESNIGNGLKGQIFYDTGTDKLMLWNDTEWVSTNEGHTALAGGGLYLNNGAFSLNFTDSTTDNVGLLPNGAAAAALDLFAMYDIGTNTHKSVTLTNIRDGLAGTSGTTLLAGDTALLQLGTTSTTALAGDTSLLQLGTTSTTALAGDTSLLHLGTTSTTALAGDTSLLQLGVTSTTALAGDTSYSTLVLGTTSTTALAGDTSLLQIGTTSTTALAGDTSLLQIGTTSTTALAGDTSLLQLGTTSTTALAGDTSLLQIGTTSITALAGDTAYSTLALGTTSTTALAGDTAYSTLALGTTSTTALAGDTAYSTLALGTTSITALAGDTSTISNSSSWYSTSLKLGYSSSTQWIDFGSTVSAIDFAIGNSTALTLSSTALKPGAVNGLTLGATTKDFGGIFTTGVIRPTNTTGNTAGTPLTIKAGGKSSSASTAQVGGHLRLYGGKGTGAGLGGNVEFYVSPAADAGANGYDATAANGEALALRIDSTRKATFADDVAINGDLTVSGTMITNNVEIQTTANGVIFEGTTGDGFETKLVATDPTGARTITLPDASFTVASDATFTPDTGAGGNDGVKGLVPASTAGDAAANKFLHADGTFAVPSGTLTNSNLVTWNATIDYDDTTFVSNKYAIITHSGTSFDWDITLFENPGSSQQEIFANITYPDNGSVKIAFTGSMPTADVKVLAVKINSSVSNITSSVVYA